MDRETETGSGLGVSLRELDTLGCGSTASSDGKLVASNVVLSTTSRASGVERNGFSAEQVVTRSNVRRNLEVELSAVVVQVLGSPEVGITLARAWCLRPAILVDLEKLSRTVSAGGILDLSHVSKDGTPVSSTNALGLAVTGVMLVHLDRDGVTSLKRAFA